ncbi:MAG: anti-phage BREX system Lon protease BrxL [Pirellulaceae bacterium]
MTQLDDKINQHFAGLVVRKDLVKSIKEQRHRSVYVLEYLLRRYATADDSINSGIETVKEILAKHYVHHQQAA